jgi:flagellar hook-basal body complex protein FliE
MLPLPPIDAVSSLGADFKLPTLTGPETSPSGPETGGFGDLLADQLGKLTELQAQSDQQAKALASGEAENISDVVMAVERASLGLQFATTVRNKAVEAYQDLFRMQI